MLTTAQHMTDHQGARFLVFEQNSYVSGLAAELFFSRFGALAPDRGQGKAWQRMCVQVFFLVMRGAGMGRQN